MSDHWQYAREAMLLLRPLPLWLAHMAAPCQTGNHQRLSHQHCGAASPHMIDICLEIKESVAKIARCELAALCDKGFA